ncbi:hypothetical protein HAX54_005119 [Datura stramonium]|uniref:Uncharacterized protein n=1 Tax=Datura stramonium TaxID=4076 RepID=A0ABS8WTA0_DATST|nr:hypothetical protein [Datura stramonium]
MADNSRMVFRFGYVELTPTLEEVLESFESLRIVYKRKTQPGDDILIPQKWSHGQVNKGLLLENVDWRGRIRAQTYRSKSFISDLGSPAGMKSSRKSSLLIRIGRIASPMLLPYACCEPLFFPTMKNMASIHTY